MRIAIIGAGLSAASCAWHLRPYAQEITLYEQAPEVGGRMATQSCGDYAFDCGAQYFTARDGYFAEQLPAWRRAGVVQDWTGRVRALDADGVLSTPSALTRMVASPGMDALVAYLLSGLEVRLGARVHSIARKAGLWTLGDEQGAQLGSADCLLICTPAAEAARLCTGFAAAERFAMRVHMTPNCTLMLGLAQPLQLDFDAAFVNSGVLSWVCRNNSKPGRPVAEAWVAQAHADWSLNNLETPDEAVRESLLAAFCAAVKQAVAPQMLQVRRWDSAMGSVEHPEGCFLDPELALGLAGDWCHGGRVEGAFLSGYRLASRVRQIFPSLA